MVTKYICSNINFLFNENTNIISKINLNKLPKLNKKKTCLLIYLRLSVSVSVFGLRPDVFPARYSVSAKSEKHTFGHSLLNGELTQLPSLVKLQYF